MIPAMSEAIAILRRPTRKENLQPIKLGFFHIVWLFLLASFLGLVGETLVSYVLDGRWESRAGYVFGPLSPLYGLGAVLFTLVGNPLRNRGIPLQFLVIGLTGGALEYFAGWFFEERYGIVAWSYIDQPLNFHGHTSVAMIVVWGVIGIVWTRWFLPVAVELIERMPERIRRPLTTIAFLFIIGDSVLTLACLDSWFWRAAGAPIETPIQQFCATYFNDEFMRTRFETMGMWTSLANR